jgi:hypothetical protein
MAKAMGSTGDGPSVRPASVDVGGARDQGMGVFLGEVGEPPVGDPGRGVAAAGGT